ncbi:hypothetical protein [Oscillatoria acuminata]|uniref:Uncharacterized protein n=1 Tax=Oscillatoria acuminata PCC 6304 TaxID=56110 RepID=K9TRV3_9CYAN|nr:hypothetical protein [Oscillatoria acuminata]AFY84886.1 hypothetical protein Oscil6304_5398 [Oscillatoria acuminata PCC 6304]
MQAIEIEPKLRELMGIASSVDPGLEYRLEEIWRWIKDMRPGLLMQKKFLMGFLLEVIKDAEFWLALKVLTDEERESFLNQLTPPVRFWYEFLFPKWFNEKDNKFYIWKQKLRSGEFNQEDAQLIDLIAQKIKIREGSLVQRYVADFSMATDAIVSSNKGRPLCVQVTSISDDFSEHKYEEWKKTLKDWNIERGIFVSYNPGKEEFVSQVVNLVLHNSSHLEESKYLKFSF